ncbi:M48 family metalloprotease [Aeoliella sp.]|uniref:M48 family metalloprotease n=1 Tax=Aeoliella sp. TaxID=2795800 RepID=UPI003CCBC5AE
MPEGENTAAREPLPYHLAIRDYLKQEEPQIWEWYASNRVRSEHVDALRVDLLKSTYRIDREADPAIYNLASGVVEQLGIDVPVTIYQAQNPEGLNASLAYLPEEAHIVLHGPLKSRLSEAEMRALLAHELGHMLLYNQWDGELLIASQVLSALTHDRQADVSHFASARLFYLYTEVFCDRVALEVSESPLEVISMLVKIATDLEEVNPESYLNQAEEILAKGPTKTEGYSHPEAYIRAHVLKLWHDRRDNANPEITELIEGPPSLDELDLTAQVRVMGWTRQLINRLLAPNWMRSDLMLAHARLFFDEYQPPDEATATSELRDQIDRGDNALRDYFCYVMIDFATADRELEEAPLAHAIGVSESIGLKDRLLELAAKELRLRKKQVEKLDHDREKLITAAEKLGVDA